MHHNQKIFMKQNKPVIYLAASKAWETIKAGKYVIYTEEHKNEGKL